MCGLFGAVDWGRGFGPGDHERFVALTDLVRYRGPDAGGYGAWRVAEQVTPDQQHFHVFLGHRRLSILDLSAAANQPFSDDQRTWIIFNGQIFNYVELRDDLRPQGHQFTTDCDTEVIVKHYRQHGENAFHAFNGMWAMAILDAARRAVVLSRDRFSIKPLYLLQEGTRLYFASEIKQLLPLASTVQPNRRALARFLNQGLADCDQETFFAGIRQLEPKHNWVISLDSGPAAPRKYWDYSTREGDGQLTPQEATGRFRELLEDSVRIRLRAHVPLGALASGGLDSSALIVMAQRFHPGIRTFSAVSDDQRFSEERYVDALCSARNLDNRKLRLSVSRSFDLLQEVIHHHDEPIDGFSYVAHYQLMREVRKASDLVVVLSGQGGDEVLMGYLKFFFFTLRDLVRRGMPFKAAREFCASLLLGTCVRQFRLAKARNYLPRWALLRPWTKQQGFLRLAVDPEPVWQVGSLQDRQRADIDRYSVPALTHYEDRNSMAHSLEIRVPFLDHRLVDFVVGLPAEIKVKNGWTKYLLRAAVPELPDAIRWRKDKQGFLTPEAEWLSGELSGVVQERFRNSLLGQMGVVDDRAFLEYYGRFRSGDSTISHHEIARVLFAELWAGQHFAAATSRASA